jgi:hypothetical protein
MPSERGSTKQPKVTESVGGPEDSRGRINDLALVLTTSQQPNQLQLSFMNVNTKPKERLDA